jgi:hypothetical protein
MEERPDPADALGFGIPREVGRSDPSVLDLSRFLQDGRNLYIELLGLGSDFTPAQPRIEPAVSLSPTVNPRAEPRLDLRP